MRCTGKSSLSTATLLTFSSSSSPLCKRATTWQTNRSQVALAKHCQVAW